MENKGFFRSIFVLLCFSFLSSMIAEKPLKVLVAVHTFPNLTGAAVLNYITGLIVAGMDVKVHYTRLGNLEKAHPDFFKYKLLECASTDMPENIEEYDIIVAQNGFIASDFIETKKKLGNKVKLITCFRGADITKRVKKYPEIYKELFEVGDMFLPVCSHFKKLLIKNKCPEEKIRVYPSSIDCNLFFYKGPQFKKGTPINIVSVSRLIPKKGLDIAIQAVSQLVNAGANLTYTIVGDGPQKDTLEQQVAMLGLKNNIIFAGHKVLKQIADILHTADIFILPARVSCNGDEEGIPNALKEAMACGLPVVSTYHSGIPELVRNKKSGLLVGQNDPSAFAQAIKYLIDNPEMSRKMGVVARKVIEKRFDKSKVNKRLIKYFYALVNS